MQCVLSSFRPLGYESCVCQCSKWQIPANTKYVYIICTTSAQRLRRWSNIVQMVYNWFVFARIHPFVPKGTILFDRSNTILSFTNIPQPFHFSWQYLWLSCRLVGEGGDKWDKGELWPMTASVVFSQSDSRKHLPVVLSCLNHMYFQSKIADNFGSTVTKLIIVLLKIVILPSR